MLADIVGYSTLMEREESRTFARLQSLREQVVNPKVAEFGGRVIKTTGDGFLAEFPSPTAALGCGITIQRTNFAQESTRDEDERFHLRIGINLGDIINRDAPQWITRLRDYDWLACRRTDRPARVIYAVNLRLSGPE
jgi:adenylate cyclase